MLAIYSLLSADPRLNLSVIFVPVLLYTYLTHIHYCFYSEQIAQPMFDTDKPFKMCSKINLQLQVYKLQHTKNTLVP